MQGSIGVHDTEQRAFTQDNANFLNAIAHVLAEAIERQGTEAKLHRARLDAEVANRAKGVSCEYES